MRYVSKQGIALFEKGSVLQGAELSPALNSLTLSTALLSPLFSRCEVEQDPVRDSLSYFAVCKAESQQAPLSPHPNPFPFERLL